MNFRDLFRGFLGLPERKKLSPENGDNRSDNRNNIPPWGRNSLSDTPKNSEENRNFGRNNNMSDLFFGDMFAAVEDMFKEMEHSMKDLDTFFQEFDDKNRLESLKPFSPDFNNESYITDIPVLLPPTKDNLRDMILKKDDIPKSEKVDRNLDELFEKSLLPLSEIPFPKPNQPIESGPNDPYADLIVPKTPVQSSSFERVYSTYTFTNGKWEGKTIKENNQGKEVTTYHRNENGEMNETKEFFPKSGIDPVDSDMNNGNAEFPFPRPFALFEKFFKPRL